MNTIQIVNIKTLEQPINVSKYLPLINTKNFYNFKQRVLLQVSIPYCNVLKNDKYSTITLVINDSQLNDMVLKPLEEQLQARVGFRSVINDSQLNNMVLKLLEEQLQDRVGFRSVCRGDDVYVKINDNTIIYSEVDIRDLERQLYDVTALITVNFYSINGSSCGLSLRCDRLKYLSADNNTTHNFLV